MQYKLNCTDSNRGINDTSDDESKENEEGTEKQNERIQAGMNDETDAIFEEQQSEKRKHVEALAFAQSLTVPISLSFRKEK